MPALLENAEPDAVVEGEETDPNVEEPVMSPVCGEWTKVGDSMDEAPCADTKNDGCPVVFVVVVVEVRVVFVERRLSMVELKIKWSSVGDNGGVIIVGSCECNDCCCCCCGSFAGSVDALW